jgi:UDP-glucose 4-epimerase
MSKVWITGARGFIGRELARQLSTAGHEVHGLGHGAWSPGAARIHGLSTWLIGEISASNLSALANITGDPAVVFHLAGGSSVGAAIAQPREDFVRTVNATSELLEWLRLECPQAALIAISSAAVYGAGHARPINEQSPPNPFSPYGAHKRVMELLCASYGASYGIQTAVGRVFSAYGPGLRKQLLWDVCSRLEKGARQLELGGDGDEVRDYVHVGDVARAIVALWDRAHASSPVVNIGCGIPTTVRSLTSLLIEGWRAAGAGENVSISFSGTMRPGDPRYLVADVAKLSAIGMSCDTRLEQGAIEYVGWFRNRHTEAD